VSFKFNLSLFFSNRTIMAETEERSANERSCDLSWTGHTINVAQIDFVYDIELNVESISADAEVAMTESVTDAMLTSIFNSHCRRRLGQSFYSSSSSRRSLQVQSISSGIRDRPSQKETCEDLVNQESVSCTRFDGSLVVTFNNVGEDATQLEVGRSVFEHIIADMMSDVYLEPVNMDLIDSNVAVTRISFVRSDFFAGLGQLEISNGIAQHSLTYEEDGLTGIGKGMVVFAVLIFLAVLGLCWGWRRELRKEAVVAEIKRDTSTVVSDEGQGGYMQEKKFRKDNQSYTAADRYDVLSTLNKMDVHDCDDSDCYVCKGSVNLNPIIEAPRFLIGQELQTRRLPISQEIPPPPESVCETEDFRGKSTDSKSSMGSRRSHLSQEGFEMEGVFRGGIVEPSVDDIVCMDPRNSPSRRALIFRKNNNTENPEFAKVVGAAKGRREVTDSRGFIQGEVERDNNKSLEFVKSRSRNVIDSQGRREVTDSRGFIQGEVERDNNKSLEFVKSRSRNVIDYQGWREATDSQGFIHQGEVGHDNNKSIEFVKSRSRNVIDSQGYVRGEVEL
jgi:hypothetical protein